MESSSYLIWILIKKIVEERKQTVPDQSAPLRLFYLHMLFSSKYLISRYLKLVLSTDNICKQNVGPDVDPNYLTEWWYC